MSDTRDFQVDEVPEYVERLERELAKCKKELAERDTPCLFTSRDNDGWWETGCGSLSTWARTFDFCPCCGHRVEVVK